MADGLRIMRACVREEEITCGNICERSGGVQDFSKSVPFSLRLFHQAQSQHVSLGIKCLTCEILGNNLSIAVLKTQHICKPF